MVCIKFLSRPEKQSHVITFRGYALKTSEVFINYLPKGFSGQNHLFLIDGESVKETSEV
jgi:hypothetical protein